ncbi:BnaC06g04190D [Brassica napus]|uniref:BnaC06g04190D protein n=1 Tax=Brassica napus TaxID=3708 RepID=A0A078GIU5_BRANA|nr:BnaC06g04190D [Brassica napus]
MRNQNRRSPRGDKISEFPDELLLKILSFLPSKDVVATSAISKRWKSLWKEVNTFRYDATPPYPLTCQMFDLFIRSRSNVESLQLKLNPNNSTQDIRDLVNDAASRSLRELRIEMVYKSFEFPQNLYLYPQLETLILEKLSLVDIPPNVSLIGLKKLNLLSVRFSNDDTYTNVMVFTIDVPTLKCLSIDNTSGESRPEGVHGFVINAPSLRCFSIKDTFSNYVRFGDMPELVKASVNIICDQPIPTAREKVQSTSSKM